MATQVWASVRRKKTAMAITVMEETADMADTEETAHMAGKVDMAEMHQIVETQEIQQQLHQATLMVAATSNQLAEMLMAVEAEMAETLTVAMVEAYSSATT